MKYLTCYLLAYACFSSSALAPVSLLAQEAATVTGRVSSAQGQPEAAVLVRIESLNAGATTGADGTYRLVIPGPRIRAGQLVNITASRTGLSPATRAIRLSPGVSLTQNFQMAAAMILLEDVVVTGTVSAVEARRVPFEVGSVTAADIQVVPINVAEAIQGRVAGATVVSGSGRPGSAPSILLRGPKSIHQADQEPLYIVDGVISGARATDIDVLDIEQIEVVKGAAAASLYGSRAANGVIQITTRGGTQAPVGIRTRGGALRLSSDFSWPPPRWTQRYDLPPSLVETDGRTLGGIFRNIRDALTRAGFDQWAVYELGSDGFVVIARRETIDDAGQPIPPRWGPAETRITWGGYLRALISATPGRYRIIAIVVSPRRFRRPGRDTDENLLTQLAVDGSQSLPPDRVDRQLPLGTEYVALIYEFYRRSEESVIELVSGSDSRISPVDHLSYAQLWTRQELRARR